MGVYRAMYTSNQGHGTLLWGSMGVYRATLAINGMEHSCGGLLGDSGRVANSLDFCPASLKSLGCFYFQCVLSSQRKAVTVNL